MRQRTSYSKPFNAQVAQECLRPGISVASVALRHGINANLVRKWIPIYRDRQVSALPAFVSVRLETAAMLTQRALARIDIACGQQALKVSWPVSDPDGCARFIRGLSQ